jgi:hypothetical protein
VKTVTNKRLLISGSHGDSNQCTPCREKPDQQDTYASHASPRTLPADGPRTWQPSTSRRQGWTESLLLRKRAHDTIPSTSADRSAGPYPVSLPSQSMKQWRKPNIHQQQATRFTRPISPACDRYIQYLLMGANQTVLNRHRRGL